MKLITIVSALMASAGAALIASPTGGQEIASSKSLPYVAIHDPQFIGAADATFLNDDDRVIGIMSGNVAKAFPASILIQHGLVEDMSPSGPIAITW